MSSVCCCSVAVGCLKRPIALRTRCSLQLVHVGYNYLYARLLEELGDVQSARLYFTKVYELFPAPPSVFIESKAPLHEKDAEDQEELCGVSLVDQLMASGDYGSAEQVMYSLMERQSVPVFGDSLKYAQILYRLGEIHEAEEWFNIALKLQPDAPDCYEALSQMCVRAAAP